MPKAEADIVANNNRKINEKQNIEKMIQEEKKKLELIDLENEEYGKKLKIIQGKIEILDKYITDEAVGYFDKINLEIFSEKKESIEKINQDITLFNTLKKNINGKLFRRILEEQEIINYKNLPDFIEEYKVIGVNAIFTAKEEKVYESIKKIYQTIIELYHKISSYIVFFIIMKIFLGEDKNIFNDFFYLKNTLNDDQQEITYDKKNYISYIFEMIKNKWQSLKYFFSKKLNNY